MSAPEVQSKDLAFASVGALAFGPQDVLFVADNRRAAIVALDVADSDPDAVGGQLEVDDLDSRLGSLLGCTADEVLIKDLAVHPRTQNVYLSVMRGAGDAAMPAIVRVRRADCSMEALPVEQLSYSEILLENAPSIEDDRLDTTLPEGNEGEMVKYGDMEFRLVRAPIRTATVTDLQYVDGTLLVAGLSNEEFSSNLRRIAFPFVGEVAQNSLEIFHVSHGKWETAAPIRTFTAYGNGSSILASYTCTPLVHFPITDMVAGTHVTGRTVAELGSVNMPLDIVPFTQKDQEYLLISNSRRPLMKIACSDIDKQEALTDQEAMTQEGQSGAPLEHPDYAGIGRMHSLNADFILAIQKDDSGGRHLRSLSTASL